MLSDGVNVLAWYSAASEAAAVATDDEVARCAACKSHWYVFESELTPGLSNK